MGYRHLYEDLSRVDLERLEEICDALEEIKYSFNSLTGEVEYITKGLDSTAVREFCRHDVNALNEITKTINALNKIISNPASSSQRIYY